MPIIGSSVRVGRIFGIPLEINYSWFIIFALVTVSIGSYLGSPSLRLGHERWIIASGTSLLFFSSVVAHELSHSLIAVRRGIPVKKITLFIFGGVAQISREASRPSTELIVAAVGPVSSVFIGFAFWLISLLLKPISSPLSDMAWWLFFINMVLAAFNMIPGFPLDGGRVLRAIIWGLSGNYRLATRSAIIMGQSIGFAMMIGGVLVFFGLDIEILRLHISGIQGVWFVFIGWYLANAATSNYHQLKLREGLRNFLARDIMSLDCPTVDTGTRLSQLANDRILASGIRCFIVEEDRSFRGIVTLRDLRRVPRKQWDSSLVQGVMTPVSKLTTVEPDKEAIEALEIMEEVGESQLVVAQGEVVLGVILLEKVISLIKARRDLGM